MDGQRARHSSAVKRLAFGLAGLLAAGCAWNASTTRGANDVVGNRLVGLPSIGMSYVENYTGQLQPHVAEAALARRNFDTSITYALAQRGSRSFGEATLPLLERYPEFRAWSATALREVLLEILAGKTAAATSPPRRRMQLEDWRFQGGVASWRRVLDADFVLLTRISEGYAIDGRKLRPDVKTGMNWMVGCILRLEDGALVWCTINHTAKTGFAGRMGAQKAADRLLKPVLDRVPRGRPPSSRDVPRSTTSPPVEAVPAEPVDAGGADAGTDATDQRD